MSMVNHALIFEMAVKVLAQRKWLSTYILYPIPKLTIISKSMAAFLNCVAFIMFPLYIMFPSNREKRHTSH